MRSLGDVDRHEFGHALDIDLRARFARPRGDGLGHRFDVTIGGIIKHQNFGHGCPDELELDMTKRGLKIRPRFL